MHHTHIWIHSVTQNINPPTKDTQHIHTHSIASIASIARYVFIKQVNHLSIHPPKKYYYCTHSRMFCRLFIYVCMEEDGLVWRKGNWGWWTPLHLFVTILVCMSRLLWLTELHVHKILVIHSSRRFYSTYIEGTYLGTLFSQFCSTSVYLLIFLRSI